MSDGRLPVRRMRPLAHAWLQPLPGPGLRMTAVSGRVRAMSDGATFPGQGPDPIAVRRAGRLGRMQGTAYLVLNASLMTQERTRSRRR